MFSILLNGINEEQQKEADEALLDVVREFIDFGVVELDDVAVVHVELTRGHRFADTMGYIWIRGTTLTEGRKLPVSLCDKGIKRYQELSSSSP